MVESRKAQRTRRRKCLDGAKKAAPSKASQPFRLEGISTERAVLSLFPPWEATSAPNRFKDGADESPLAAFGSWR